MLVGALAACSAPKENGTAQDSINFSEMRYKCPNQPFTSNPPLGDVLIPLHSIDNIVTSFTAHALFKAFTRPIPRIFNEVFDVYVYDSHSKHNQEITLRDKRDVDLFLQGDGFDILKFYKKGSSPYRGDAPLAILLRTGYGPVYTFFYLQQHDTQSDSLSEYSLCDDYWDSNLVDGTAFLILKKMAITQLNREGIILPPENPAPERRRSQIQTIA